MHQEILSPEQIALFPLLKTFSKSGFYLVGRTGIALYLGHRRSIDFDLFTDKSFKHDAIRKTLVNKGFKVQRTLYVDDDQLDLVVENVKVTFFFYPYEVNPSYDFDKIITLPSLLNLASMKAYALGRRAKWKDYVDLYFILNDQVTLREITYNSKQLFGGMFNEKLFVNNYLISRIWIIQRRSITCRDMKLMMIQ